MPHTPPFHRRANPLNEKEFYRRLSAQCNYVDEGTVRLMYLGLVIHITNELRTTGLCRVPMLGDFVMAIQKPKIGLWGPRQVRMGERPVLRFYPRELWRRYFNRMQTMRD